MKIFFVAVLLLFCSKVFADPQFLELKSGQSQYVVGDKAVLIASVRTSPTDPSMEIYLDASWAASPIKMIRFSDTEYAVVTPPMLVADSYHWEVKAYLQNRETAKGIWASIAVVDKENIQLQQRYLEETDPEKKNLLQQAIDENNILRATLVGQLEQNRTLVETKELYVYAAEVKKGIQKRLSSPLVLSTDKYENTFTYGEGGNLNVEFVPSEIQETYEVEPDIEVALDSNEIALTKITDTTYQAYLDVNLLTVGSHTATANLYIRNKRDSVSLLDAIDRALSRKVEAEQLRDQETNSAMIAYYQREVDDLAAIISAFYDVHLQMRQFTGSASLSLEVVDVSPVVIDQVQIYTSEGSMGTYSISLSTEPTADVTVTASSPDSEVSFSNRKNGQRSSQVSLTFTSANWNVPQAVSIAVADNSVVNGERIVKITHTSSGGDYEGVRVPDVFLNIYDNDSGNLLFDIPQVDLSINGGPGQYGLSLSAEPISDVQVVIDTSVLKVNGEQSEPVIITFTPLNWNQSQIITVEVPPGAQVTANDYYHLSHTVNGTGPYGGQIAGMVFWITDY